MSDAHPSVDGASLAAVLAMLDPSVVSAVGSIPDESVVVREVVLWDALERLAPARDGLLLLVGSGPAHPLIAETIADAGRSGHSAVAIKTRGTHPAVAAEAARAGGVVLLKVADDVPWVSVESLFVAAMSAHGADARGGFGDRATSDLFALADTVAALTDAAVTIEDVDRHVLAYSNVPGQRIDASRQDTILGRYVPDLPEHLAEYRELARSPGPVCFAPYDGTLARVVMPVRVGGRLIGSIWAIDASGVQGDRIGKELAAVAPQVALHLLRAANRSDLDRHRRSELLSAQLTSSGTSETQGGRTTKHQLPVALVGFGPVHGTDNVVDEYRLTNMIALNVESACRDAWCAQVDDTIFVLLPRVDRFANGWVERLASSAVRAITSTLQVRIGCAYAPRIVSHEVVPLARADIDTALRRQATQAEPRLVDVTRDRYVVQLQNLVESGIAAAGQLIPQVAELLEYDRAHRSSYARTLLTHLDCFGDVRRAADLLSVHENSHRYRMRKLVEQFQIELGDPELRLMIWLQLRIAIGSETAGSS